MSDAKQEKFGEGVIIRPRGIPKDPPISRDRLGAPGTVKVLGGPYGPATAVLRPCFCVECRKNFASPVPSMLCPACEGGLNLACSMTDTLPEGNLPPMMTRTRGASKPVSGTGVRPKIQGDTVKKG